MSGGRRDGRGRARGGEVADGATPLLARGRESVLGCGALIPGVRDRRGAPGALARRRLVWGGVTRLVGACRTGGGGRRPVCQSRRSSSRRPKMRAKRAAIRVCSALDSIPQPAPEGAAVHRSVREGVCVNINGDYI